MTQRIKGQEVSVFVAGPDGDEDSFENIGDLEISVNLEILEEGYLGQVANEYDDIFNGVTGKISAHLSRSAYFRFQQKVQDRAQRRTPADEKFNIGARLSFPNGETARVTIEDVKFGPLPLTVGGRKEYVDVPIDFASSKIRRVF
jgi:hypothetical protein